MSVNPMESLSASHKVREVEMLTSPGFSALSKTGPLDESQTAQYDLRESDDTLFLRRTVRSGQAIHHASNIVVLGDVNPGAEILAGGDILASGVLLEMAHAAYPAHHLPY